MTEKENLMRSIRGEEPAWLPTFTWGKMPGSTEDPPSAKLGPSFLFKHRDGPEGVDYWGVKHVANAETNYASLPEPNNFILKDITKWRDVIKRPDISGINWEEMARKDLEKAGLNPDRTAIVYHTHVGYFQTLMSFMGFTEGLCAMYEEPEEVKALFEFLSDFYVEVAEKSIDYYKPEFIGVTDDTATKLNPFISPEMFEELLMPSYRKHANVGLRRGLPAEMHNCGRCEDFIDYWFELGVVAWDPAQTTNDLKGIKEKYGDRLTLIGCWEPLGDLMKDDCPEDVFKQSVIDTIDTFAPGGRYCWSGNVLALPGDEAANRKNRWIKEVVDTYGREFYKK